MTEDNIIDGSGKQAEGAQPTPPELTDLDRDKKVQSAPTAELQNSAPQGIGEEKGNVNEQKNDDPKMKQTPPTEPPPGFKEKKGDRNEEKDAKPPHGEREPGKKRGRRV